MNINLSCINCVERFAKTISKSFKCIIIKLTFMNDKFLVIKSVQGSKVAVSGYASVFDIVDAHGDVVLNGAFSKSVQHHSIHKHVKFLWQHDISKPIGIITHMEEDDYGLFIEAEINLLSTYGREAAELIKQGAVNSFSIGFELVSFSKNRHVREISEINLVEISIVTIPANSSALIEHVSNKSRILRDFEKKFTDAINAVESIAKHKILT